MGVAYEAGATARALAAGESPTRAAACTDAGARDRTLDLLRGYFLVVMTVDHLRAFPSLFELVTGRGQMWASAAEGFFVISGFLVGRLRGSEARRHGFRPVWAKLLSRALKIYAAGTVLTIAFTMAGRAFEYEPAVTHGLSHDPLLDVAWKALLLRYNYGPADMLSVYAVMLVLSPVCLLLLVRGRLVILATASAAIWLFALLMPRRLFLTASYFPELSWQVVFVFGIILGDRWPVLQDRWRRLAGETRRRVFRVVSWCASVTLALSWLDRYAEAFPDDVQPYLETAFHHTRLGPGRLAVFGVWMAFLWMWVKRHERPLLRWVGPFLEPLGRNSLYVYVVHSVLVFPFLAGPLVSFWEATLLDAAVLAVLWMMVRHRVLFGFIPR